MSISERNSDLIYQLEGKPPFAIAFPLGIQHILAMFIGNLAPILIISGAAGVTPEQTTTMVQAAMFASGITTLIQLWPIKIGPIRIGSGLPIVMGTSFGFVATSITIVSHGAFTPELAIGALTAAIILGSVIELIMGVGFKYVKALFPPLVVGSVLLTIGWKLLSVGVHYFAGGIGAPDYGSIENLFLGFSVFTIIMLLQRFAKGVGKVSAILIGIIVGYVLAILMGKVNFDAITANGYINFPLPFAVAAPNFDIPVQMLISFAVLYIVSGLETIGNTSGITVGAFNRPATEKETAGAILADAVGSAFAGLFNAMPNTAFGQNAGIITMTKVVNRWVIALGAFTLIAAAFFPPIGAVMAAMPSSVLGGAVITIFAMILINGIKLVASAGFGERNVFVMAITLGIGVGIGFNPQAVKGLPEWISWIFDDTIVSVCVVSILANLIFPMGEKSKSQQQEFIS